MLPCYYRNQIKKSELHVVSYLWKILSKEGRKNVCKSAYISKLALKKFN